MRASGGGGAKWLAGQPSTMQMINRRKAGLLATRESSRINYLLLLCGGVSRSLSLFYLPGRLRGISASGCESKLLLRLH